MPPLKSREQIYNETSGNTELNTGTPPPMLSKESIEEAAKLGGGLNFAAAVTRQPSDVMRNQSQAPTGNDPANKNVGTLPATKVCTPMSGSGFKTATRSGNQVSWRDTKIGVSAVDAEMRRKR
jgi:hypothetical protein